MKKIVLLLFISINIFAQEKEDFNLQVSEISEKMEKIIVTNKNDLKKEILQLEKLVEHKELTQKQAEQKKKELAILYSKKIKLSLVNSEKELQKIIQNKINNNIRQKNNTTKPKRKGDKIRFRKTEVSFNKKNRNRYYITLSLGLNNLTPEKNNEKRSFWGSKTYEIGILGKYRISKIPSKLYLNYGLSYVKHRFSNKGNYYETFKDHIILKKYPTELKKSSFEFSELNIPLTLEFDTSKNHVSRSTQKVYDRRNKNFRIGFGGFAGIRLCTKQKLEYRRNELDIEEVQKDNFNMQRFVYGLNAHVGYSSFVLYSKYNLNSVFKNGNQRNLSIGLRVDL